MTIISKIISTARGTNPLRLNSIASIRAWLKTNHLPEALNTSISQTLNNLIAVEKFDYIQLQESGEAEPVGLILDVYRNDEFVATETWWFDDFLTGDF